MGSEFWLRKQTQEEGASPADLGADPKRERERAREREKESGRSAAGSWIRATIRSEFEPPGPLVEPGLQTSRRRVELNAWLLVSRRGGQRGREKVRGVDPLVVEVEVVVVEAVVPPPPEITVQYQARPLAHGVIDGVLHTRYCFGDKREGQSCATCATVPGVS